MKYFLAKSAVLGLSLVLLPFKIFAWNPVGHMVIANIAYQQLHPNARATVDSLVVQMSKDYASLVTFSDMATWPDSLKAQKIDTYSHWHYIDMAFSNDGTPTKNEIDTDNALWAVNLVQAVVKNEHANPNERARFLSFLAHIVGDLQQPLHTVSFFSSTHLNGDKGGNEYFVKHDNKSVNIHALWDAGVGIFDEDTSIAHINSMTTTLMAMYPESSFRSQEIDLVPDHWVKEGMDVAKQYVYTTPEKQEMTTAYLETGRHTAEQQAVLAGYRLGALLNLLLDKG